MQYGRSRVEITLTPLKMSYEMHPCTIYLKKKNNNRFVVENTFLQLFINPTYQLVCNQYTVLLCKGIGTC